MPQALTKQQIIISLIKDIQRDIADYHQLHALMLKQHQCYLTFNGNALTQLTAQQHPLIETLKLRSQQRYQSMQSLGLPISAQGIDKLHNVLPTQLQKQVQQQWSQLESLIKQCHALNQQNGVLSANFTELLCQLYEPEAKLRYAFPHLMQG
ncbi:flagellar export chaperone FlgN [Photobacterium leiognathi]|uniref:flagellar export chaperone FlgN n=1 Tax=Photobacterium leiognathi TaxID=553611 RepID=UPI002981E6F8|nr:flagellar export chaperone FlgN [Photobacterium leiognathi]